MTSRRTERISDIQAHFVEIVITIIVVAFGINVFSSGIVDVVGKSSVFSVVLGIILVAAGCWFFFRRMESRADRFIDVEGAFVRSESGKLIDIDNYAFSEEIGRSMRALFAENKAMSSIWDSSVDEHAGNISEKSLAIVREAAEYFLISSLSLHLSSYFTLDVAPDEKTLKKYHRTDIPAILLSNRFLDMFSRKPSEREAFLSEKDSIENDEYNIVYSISASGVIYKRFELILPIKSNIKREEDGIKISTSKFDMHMGVDYEGYNSLLPRDFAELYLNMDMLSARAYQIKARISVKFKPFSLLTRKGWEYHEWIDSFLDRIEKDMSLAEFVSASGWNIARTAYLIERNGRRPRKVGNTPTVR